MMVETPIPRVVTTLLLLGALLWPAAARAGGAVVGRPAPLFRLKTFPGKEVTTYSLRGKPTVLVVGRSRKSAPPCKDWMLKVHKDLGDKKIHLYQVIVLDNPWYLPRALVRGKVKSFVPQGYLPRVLLEWKLAFARIFAIPKHNLPVIFVLDKKGVVRLRYKGKLSKGSYAKLKRVMATLK